MSNTNKPRFKEIPIGAQVIDILDDDEKEVQLEEIQLKHIKEELIQTAIFARNRDQIKRAIFTCILRKSVQNKKRDQREIHRRYVEYFKQKLNFDISKQFYKPRTQPNDISSGVDGSHIIVYGVDFLSNAYIQSKFKGIHPVQVSRINQSNVSVKFSEEQNMQNVLDLETMSKQEQNRLFIVNEGQQNNVYRWIPLKNYEILGMSRPLFYRFASKNQTSASLLEQPNDLQKFQRAKNNIQESQLFISCDKDKQFYDKKMQLYEDSLTFRRRNRGTWRMGSDLGQRSQRGRQRSRDQRNNRNNRGDYYQQGRIDRGRGKSDHNGYNDQWNNQKDRRSYTDRRYNNNRGERQDHRNNYNNQRQNYGDFNRRNDRQGSGRGHNQRDNRFFQNDRTKPNEISLEDKSIQLNKRSKSKSSSNSNKSLSFHLSQNKNLNQTNLNQSISFALNQVNHSPIHSNLFNEQSLSNIVEEINQNSENKMQEDDKKSNESFVILKEMKTEKEQRNQNKNRMNSSLNSTLNNIVVGNIKQRKNSSLSSNSLSKPKKLSDKSIQKGHMFKKNQSGNRDRGNRYNQERDDGNSYNRDNRYNQDRDNRNNQDRGNGNSYNRDNRGNQDRGNRNNYQKDNNLQYNNNRGYQNRQRSNYSNGRGNNNRYDNNQGGNTNFHQERNNNRDYKNNHQNNDSQGNRENKRDYNQNNSQNIDQGNRDNSFKNYNNGKQSHPQSRYERNSKQQISKQTKTPTNQEEIDY